MSTLKHTPGPWEVIDRAQQHNTDALHRYLIMQPEGNNTFIAKTIKEYDSVDDLSNARLIAAAPELLDALRLVLAHDGALTGADWTAIRAAIAKAEGEG